jgi:hypothetical protein
MKSKIISVLIVFCLVLAAFSGSVAAFNGYNKTANVPLGNYLTYENYDNYDVSDGVIYYVANEGYTNGQIAAHDISTDTQLWQKNISSRQSVTVNGNYIYASGFNIQNDPAAAMMIINKNTQNVVAKYQKDVTFEQTAPYGSNAVATVETFGGNITVVDSSGNKVNRKVGNYYELQTTTAGNLMAIEKIPPHNDPVIRFNPFGNTRTLNANSQTYDDTIDVAHDSATNTTYVLTPNSAGPNFGDDVYVYQNGNLQNQYSYGSNVLFESIHLSDNGETLTVARDDVHIIDTDTMQSQANLNDAMFAAPISDGKIITHDSNNISVWQTTVTSLNTSISGNTNSHTSVGSNQFNVDSVATFSDNSTKDVTSDVTYSYDSSIVTQVSGNTFKGAGVGTTDIQATYVGASGNTVTNNVTVNIQNPITNAELVYPTGDSTSLTGPEDFEIATELTRQDGTTFYADNADLTYTYDSSIIEKTSQGTINTEVFAGINSGTTNIQATYSGFGGTTETTNTDTVTVSDPATVDSVDIVTPNNFTHDEGESKDLDASISYSDGSGALITSSPDLTFTSSNTTIVGVSPQSGFTTANFYGNATITMEYYDSWYGTTYSTTADITVLGDRQNIDFKIKDSEIKRDEKTSMSAVMDYEDGRTKNIPVNTGDINAVPSGNETFDNVNNTVSFSESNITYTLTYNYQANGQGYADFDTVEVEPVRDFEDFNKLTPYGQVFAIFDNWGFWAMLASILGGVLVGIKLTAEAGLGVMTVMLALSWVGGLVSIFIPTTLILFEIFLFAVLDVSLTN